MSKHTPGATTQALLKQLGETAQREADRLDPKRLRDQNPDDMTRSIVGKLDAISRSAGAGYWILRAKAEGK